MTTVLEVSNLTKRFNKKKLSVNQINFSIQERQIYGIVGPNGSGKSTTLNMILSLLKPTEGSIKIFGKTDLQTQLKKVGALLEDACYYSKLSAYNNLKISANIKKIEQDKIEEALKFVDLLDEKKNKVKTFSLGMKQRLSMASVLLNEPELIILDEPTNGLDPQGIVKVREFILDLAKKGKTILIASHLLSEMEKICTHLSIMKNGKILETGETKSLIKDHKSLEDFFIQKTK